MQARLCYSVKDAATQLSLSRTKLFELIGRGELRSFKLDGKRLVPVAALHDLVQRKLGEQEAVSVRSAGGFETRGAWSTDAGTLFGAWACPYRMFRTTREGALCQDVIKTQRNDPESLSSTCAQAPWTNSGWNINWRRYENRNG